MDTLSLCFLSGRNKNNLLLGTGYDLLPQNSMSEDNELHNFTDNGIPSLYFTNQYTTNNDGSQSTCNGQGFSITITTTSTTSLSIQMSFAGGEYVSVGVFD